MKSYSEVVRFISFMAMAAGEINQYSAYWSPDFCVRQIKDRVGGLQYELRDVDWNSFSRDELLSLGFGNWDGKLLTIPIHLWNAMPDHMEVKSISGSTRKVVDVRKDDDIRFGCVAFGFIKPEAEEVPNV